MKTKQSSKGTCKSNRGKAVPFLILMGFVGSRLYFSYELGKERARLWKLRKENEQLKKDLYKYSKETIVEDFVDVKYTDA